MLLGYASPDGIRWKRLREEPILSDGKFDSLNVAVLGLGAKPLRGLLPRLPARRTHHQTCHLAELPGLDSRAMGRFRGRSLRSTSTPTGRWPTFALPHLFLALPRRFLPWRQLYPDAPVPGASDGVFMSSRDGVHWDRRFLESFIRPGHDPRNWPQRTNTPARGIVPTAGDEISLYVERHRSAPTNHLQRLVLRTDGFVSVHAGYSGGRDGHQAASSFNGDNLALNFSTSAAGSIRVEIQDVRGHPVPGFSLEESPLIWGDEIEHVVRWERTFVPRQRQKSPSGPSRREAGAPAAGDEGCGPLLPEIPIADRATALGPEPGPKGSRQWTSISFPIRFRGRPLGMPSTWRSSLPSPAGSCRSSPVNIPGWTASGPSVPPSIACSSLRTRTSVRRGSTS